MNLIKSTRAPLVFLLSLFCALQAFALDYDIQNKEQVEAFVDGALLPLMDKAHSQSAVIIIQKDNQVILSKGYGYANREEGINVDPSTSIFRPGSISKLYTWVSVMQLVEEGKLDLDEDVNLYLNTFKVKDTYPGQPVTLRHIMTHTAGFEDSWMGTLIIKDPSKILPLPEALARFQPERVYAPGERVAYSNWATALAGLIVSNVSGEEFSDYVKGHIFDPLGMSYATFLEPLPEELAPYEAKPYLYEGGVYVPQSYEYIGNVAPAGASAMSATEMVKFGQMIINGGSYKGAQILQEETIHYMVDNGFVKDSRVRGMGLGFLHYAYGSGDLDLFGHTGDTTLFHSLLGLSEKENLVVFISVSTDETVRDDFLKQFYEAFYPMPLEDIEAPLDFVDYGSKYEGSYLSSRSNYSKAESIFRVPSVVNVSLVEDNSLLIEGNRYVLEEKNLFRGLYSNTRIAFLEDEQGYITGYVVDGAGHQEFFRARWWEYPSSITFLLVFTTLLNLLVLIRSPLQGKIHKVSGKAASQAYTATLVMVGVHFLTFILLMLTILAGGDLAYAVPFSLKLALCFSTLTIPVVFYHIYTTVRSWMGQGVVGTWSKIKHTILSLNGLFMVIFYFLWNLVGFKI
jgi:CubicO group peptidase (beta-lactamase class C family)